MGFSFWTASRERIYVSGGKHCLIAGLEHEFYEFPYIENVIIPTDELIFFRGVGIPPTVYIYIAITGILFLYSFFGQSHGSVMLSVDV